MPRTSTVNLRYGNQRMMLAVPPRAVVLSGPPIPACTDPRRAVAEALAAPIGSSSLAQIVADKRPRTVAITISDITRPVPNEPVVSEILNVLNAGGISDSQVVVIIATGMHRPSTPAERRIMLGEELLSRLRVVDHIADDAQSLVPLCQQPPVSINRLFMEADLKIVTGLIEPHFMAGYSGGRKGVCPGLVDLRTVQRFHGYRVMGDANSVEGKLLGNPCHEESVRIASLVAVDFLVNVAITHDRRLAGVWAGDMTEAHDAGCQQVGQWTSAAVPEPFDLVITSAGGYPLDANFYQSVKGMVGALPALAARSTLLIASACGEIGSPEYSQIMARYGHDWRRFLADIAVQRQVIKDQWQYQMHCRVLDRIGVERLLLANDGLPIATQRDLAVTPLPGPGDAVARAQHFIDDFDAAHPGSRIAVIPEGPYTMLRGG